MATALIYLLVVLAVAAVFFGIAALVFGRGEELPPLPPDATPTRLPPGEIHGEHVRSLRFPQAVRGYRMTEVDWVLDRLGQELDSLRGELAAVRATHGLDEPAHADAGHGAHALPTDEAPEQP